jgi:hypothetical protein
VGRQVGRTVDEMRTSAAKRLDDAQTALMELTQKHSTLLQKEATRQDALLEARELQEKIVAAAKAEAAAEAQKRIDIIEKQAKQQVANLKEQSAFFIRERTEQLQSMVAAHEAYKAEQVRHLDGSPHPLNGAPSRRLSHFPRG